MNFLSHFYFTQHNDNPYYTLGTILPDLFRNHDKSWKFQPVKLDENFNSNPDLAALIEGWKLHLLVDKIFHSSPSFTLHSSALRNELSPIFTRLPIRPFFLAHIGYELVLDGLLIRNQIIDTDLFYQLIASSDHKILHDLLVSLGVSNPLPFVNYLDRFIENKYLESYRNPRSIVSAIDYIGRSVWQEKFNEMEYKNAEVVFQNFQHSLSQNFLEVFELIEGKLPKG